MITWTTDSNDNNEDAMADIKKCAEDAVMGDNEKPSTLIKGDIKITEMQRSDEARKAFEEFQRKESPPLYDCDNVDAWHIWQASRAARDAELVGLLEKERSSYQRLENHGLDRAIEIIRNGAKP